MSFPCYAFSDAALLQVAKKLTAQCEGDHKADADFWFAYVQPSSGAPLQVRTVGEPTGSLVDP